MNKEYWLDYIEKNHEYSKRAIIKDLFDDIESRICKNCKYKHTISDTSIECLNMESPLGYTDIEYSPKFGCNKFKRIDEVINS